VRKKTKNWTHSSNGVWEWDQGMKCPVGVHLHQSEKYKAQEVIISNSNEVSKPRVTF